MIIGLDLINELYYMIIRGWCQSLFKCLNMEIMHPDDITTDDVMGTIRIPIFILL